MIKVGLTGNIGSGKSMAARIFEILHVPLFYADDEAKKILDTPEVVSGIRNIFGEHVIEKQFVNRKFLAEIVFNDKSKLALLNEIIHPAVRAKFDKWAQENQHYPYVVYEAAILLESGHAKNMDKIIVVTACESLRIKRVMQRDGATKEMVLKRMENQWAESKKIEYADFIIDNNGSELMIPQVLKIHGVLGSYAAPVSKYT